MNSQQKFFSWLFGFQRETNGELKYMVEYSSIGLPARSGKIALSVQSPVNENQMTSDLKDSLALHLSQRFAPESFTSRNIIGLAI